VTWEKSSRTAEIRPLVTISVNIVPKAAASRRRDEWSRTSSLNKAYGHMPGSMPTTEKWLSWTCPVFYDM
jgi:hypothetical protein